MKRERPLRDGFTTGTAAAGAAKAATLHLLAGLVPATIDVPLPAGARLTLPVAEVRRDGDGALAVVVKDGGDDPDVTNSARIGCRVTRTGAASPGAITLLGGQGVGRVTLPGLPVAVGEPAINPGPRSQIRAAVAEAATQVGYTGGLAVEVRVVNGEALARKTLNPRLGIVGGISILGVSGIVRPFSHQAWEASIAEALDVAKALGHDTVGFSTGRRTESLLRRQRPELPETACIQAADCFAVALSEAAKRGFTHIVWAVFGGKLVKMAQGLPNTHAHRAETDFLALSDRCRQAGWPESLAAQAATANTARHALDMAPTPQAKVDLVTVLADAALGHMRHFAGGGAGVGGGGELELYVYDFDGVLLARRAMDARGAAPGPRRGA